MGRCVSARREGPLLSALLKRQRRLVEGCQLRAALPELHPCAVRPLGAVPRAPPARVVTLPPPAPAEDLELAFANATPGKVRVRVGAGGEGSSGAQADGWQQVHHRSVARGGGLVCRGVSSAARAWRLR